MLVRRTHDLTRAPVHMSIGTLPPLLEEIVVNHPCPSRVTFTVLTALAMMVVGPSAAEAQYLDPGAASIIVQAVVAGVFAVGATLKLYGRRLSGLFSRHATTDSETREPRHYE